MITARIWMTATLVFNEQTKLLANAYDRLSTACVSVGVLAPIAGAYLNLAGPNLPDSNFIVCCVTYLFAGYVFNRLSLRVLKGLRE
jgi:hypothetical protein